MNGVATGCIDLLREEVILNTLALLRIKYLIEVCLRNTAHGCQHVTIVAAAHDDVVWVHAMEDLAIVLLFIVFAGALPVDAIDPLLLGYEIAHRFLVVNE